MPVTVENEINNSSEVSRDLYAEQKAEFDSRARRGDVLLQCR